MERVAVIDGLRTPFCKMGTDFDAMGAEDLGAMVARELLTRLAFDPHHIDEVIFGNVCQPAGAANISRVIALFAGVPNAVPAVTVHRNCASGLEAVTQAQLKIQAKQGQVYLVGGTESMSQVPFLLSRNLQKILTRWSRAKTLKEKWETARSFRWNDMAPRVGLEMGLTDPVCGLNMGQTAEVLAREFGISRAEQDEFALRSHQRASAARALLREEIMPVIPPPDYQKVVVDDNGPRDEQSLAALGKLRPYFDRTCGTVTAGNSSQITDGAVALLMMSESRAKKLGLSPLGFIRASRVVGVDPRRMGIGPAHAIPQLLKKAGLPFKEIPAMEINEAFAVQVLSCVRALASDAFTKEFRYEGFTGEVNPEILNVNGGAIALGHPVGSSGARLILTMLKRLRRQNLPWGVVSLCVGGGQGVAMILERADEC
jgi:acetyl-CoA acyltransferase